MYNKYIRECKICRAWSQVNNKKFADVLRRIKGYDIILKVCTNFLFLESLIHVNFASLNSDRVFVTKKTVIHSVKINLCSGPI
jgi:hypothetical protein